MLSSSRAMAVCNSAPVMRLGMAAGSSAVGDAWDGAVRSLGNCQPLLTFAHQRPLRLDPQVL
ncbi:MAG: hypothetical protein DI635_04755 [Pseudoxanthomonas suwonensis]|nr:MAG: hypothetical protein DI635_04755 [Pseudoxanthomonas suwonensis]